MNSVFRVNKYAVDYPAFVGKDLTPGEFVELYPDNVENEVRREGTIIYPNPVGTSLFIKGFDENSYPYRIINIFAQSVQTGSLSNDTIDFSALPTGSYLLIIGTYIYKIIKN